MYGHGVTLGSLSKHVHATSNISVRGGYHNDARGQMFMRRMRGVKAMSASGVICTPIDELSKAHGAVATGARQLGAVRVG